MKKLIATLCILCIFSFSISALNKALLTPGEEFTVYSEDTASIVASALNIKESDLAKTVSDNGITFLAVNNDNTKQIQLTCSETEFSNTVINLSNYSNDSINALLPEISGLENIKGEIVLKDGQKYVKINLRNTETKNEYILTQYFTVMDKKMYTLSFYTESGQDTDYIEQTFTTSSGAEIEIKPENNYGTIRIIVICATIIFGLVCVVLVFTIIKDLIANKKSNNNKSDLETTEE